MVHKMLQQQVAWLLKPTVPRLREPDPAFGNHEFQLSVRDIEHLSQTHGGLHLQSSTLGQSEGSGVPGQPSPHSEFKVSHSRIVRLDFIFSFKFLFNFLKISSLRI